MEISRYDLENRIQLSSLRSKCISKENAAELFCSGMTVGCSGFVAMGAPKVILKEVARRGVVSGLRLLSGGGTGPECVNELAKAQAISFLAPYNNDAEARKQINAGEIAYVDMHLSDMPDAVRRGLLGHIDVAVIECCMVDANGGIVPTLSVGASEAFVECADKILLELNLAYPETLFGLHTMSDGSHSIKCDPQKIAGIVLTDELGHLAEVPAPSAVDNTIAENVVHLIEQERNVGRIKGGFAIEPGIGAVAVAVFSKMSETLTMNKFNYVGVVQDSAIDLLLSGTITHITGAALRLSTYGLNRLLTHIDKIRGRIEILPQDKSNNPGGLCLQNIVAVNTAIEVDILGNVNSTHIFGNRIMNGIGGAADFTRHSTLSIFMTPSVMKKESLSCVVPLVSHVDHTAYDADFIVTEIGYADLRCKTPCQRAEAIIEHCAHPQYRAALREYLQGCDNNVFSPINLTCAYDWHQRYIQKKTMKLP